MANDDQTPTPAPAPQEGFLHSLASSLGADPETIKATVRAIIANPKQAFSEVGHEIADEAVDAISHPKQTLKDTTTGLVQGVPSLLPNPEAAKVAQRRLQQPGLRNKLTGVRESLEAAVPMAGAGLVKGEEQSAEGNDTGALGTAVGTLAPFVIGGEAAEGGEAAKPDIFTEAGGRQVASAARVHSLVAQPEFNAKIIPAAAPDEEPAEGLEGLKFSTDPNGIKWAENKDGVRVSIPKKISSGAAADYAKTKINEQAAMQKQLRASISPKLIESAGATQVTPPEPEAVPYHPDLQKIADKYGSSYSPQGSAAFIAPDGKFINLPEGVQHPNAITQATGKADRLVDNRPEFLKDTGAVRIRTTTQPYRGSLVNVSVPENMTPEQVQSIQQAVGKASQESGRNAHLTLERANVTTASKDSATTFKEHVSPRDVEPMLKQIGAHPDQRAEAVKPAAVATPEAKPDVYELNADEGEEAPAVAPEHIQSLGNEFNKTAGRPEINSTHVGDDPRTPQIAQAYEDSKHEPDNPKVQSSYAALKKDIKDQYNVLRKDGFTINAQETDPYEGTGMGPNEGPYRALREDVLNNKNITVWKGGEPPADHPMSERDPESGLTYNEMFRAIHDVFGHVAHDKNFTLNGEENAWNLHRQMFSQEALPALLTETKGQTAYVTTKGQFADQRATILPEEFHTREDDPTAGTATRTDKTPTTPTTALGNLNEWWNERAPGTKDAGTKGGLLQKKLLEPAGGVDPRTGNFDTTGKGVEILPELRQPLDHAPTAEDFQKFYEQHKELFDKNPELRVGWDNNSAEKGGHEINVGAVGEGAAKVARKLDQKSAFDIAKGENIPTGGTGLRRNFPEYSPEDRLRDLREEEPDVVMGEHQSPLKEPYNIRITDTDGNEHTASVDAFSPKQAIRTAQKKFPSASEWAIDSFGSREPSTKYTVPENDLHRMKSAGRDPVVTIRHELGHHLIGAKEGLVQKGIISHLHAAAASNTNAAIIWDGSDIMSGGRIRPDKQIPLLRASMGGIAADEVFNDTPRTQNQNFNILTPGSDGHQSYQILRTAGFDHDSAISEMHKFVDENKQYLQQPAVSDIIHENAGVRESGLSRQYHISPERLQQMHAEVQRRLGNGEIDNGAGSAKTAGDSEGNVAAGKGKVSGAGSEIPPKIIASDIATSPTVSTRVPTKMVKGALSEDHSNQSLVSDMAAAEAAPGYVAKMVDRIKNIPGFIGSTEDAAATAKAYIRHVADNVKFVHDQITPEEFDRDSKWYPVGAHERIQEVAKRHGFTPNQIAGVTAVESPMTDWHQNTSLAERTAAIWKNQQNTKFSPEMQIAADEITSLPANKAFKAPYRQLRGKTLADLDGNIPLQAHWLRLYDEAHNPREYQTWSPDGKPAGLALNYNGQPASVGWSFQSHIEKAIRILKDGSPENISQALGYGHKVRNFYNNLIAPNDPRFLTLDTHAVNGGQLRALSSNSPDLKTHFGAIKNGPHGLKGVYPLHDAAYRLAAKELDISVPSRLQSAVWTKVQKLFSAEFKTPENVAKIDSIWKEHSDGKITADQARKRIWDFASRWDDSTDEGTQHPNDQSQLFETGVRGEAAKGTAGRGNRSGASRTVSDAVSSDEGDTSFNFGANER